MADIKVYGTLVNETEDNKIAYADQVYHKRREKDVATILDELEDTVAQLPPPTDQTYKGRINITDLLALTDQEENDLYLVYSSGSDSDGWSVESTFTLNNVEYPDGTFIQWMVGEWVAVNPEEVEIGVTPIFQELQPKIGLISTTFPESSYPELYGAWREGMKIAEVYNYKVGDDGRLYIPDEEIRTGRYGGRTNKRTISIPWCRSYASGVTGMTRNYTGGLLKDVDYEKLMESARVFILDSEKTTSVTTIDTNGTAPYNSSYGTTEISVSNNGVAFEIREGFLLSITNKQLSIDQDHRNVRIKFTSATNTIEPIPLFDVDGTILDGYKEIQPGKTTNLFQYRIGMSTGNGFYKILTEGNIKEIQVNGQTVTNEDGIINLEVDSTSARSLQTRETLNVTGEAVWEEIGYFTVDNSGADSVIEKSAVFSVRCDYYENFLSTVGCQIRLVKNNDQYDVAAISCIVDNPGLREFFILAYKKSNGRCSLFVRRENTAQQFFLYCISSLNYFTQSSDTSSYSYSSIVSTFGTGNFEVGKYNGSIVIGDTEYLPTRDGQYIIEAFPDHHLKSNYSQFTGWSEVGYGSYEDFYSYKKSLTYSISERTNASTSTDKTNTSGILTLTLFGTSNHDNYRFETFDCVVDNQKLVDKIRVTYDRNAASDKNIKIYVKCDFPYQEWTLQDLSGTSSFKCTAREIGDNDYLANVTKPTTGQIASSTFSGGGTITEVQLNGQTVSTSGVANVQALPLRYFYTSGNNGTTYTNKWKEAAYSIVSDTNSVLSFSQVFSVRDRLGSLSKYGGIMTVTARVSYGNVSHLTCDVDNPNLEGLFKAIYDNSTGRLSIFGKSIGGWNCWGLTSISDSNYFAQGLDVLVDEPSTPASGMLVSAGCYTSGGEGTITEVQLNGQTVSTSGVANVEAMPLKKFSLPAEGYSGYWKEIARASQVHTKNVGYPNTYVEIFTVRGQSTSTECRDGLLAIEFTLTAATSSGKINTLRCFTDNPALTKYFSVVFYNGSHSCSIFAAQPSSWILTCTSDSIFEQGTNTSSYPKNALLSSESEGKITDPVCYIDVDNSFEQVQADWRVTDSNSPAFIQGKPSIIEYRSGDDYAVAFQENSTKLRGYDSALYFTDKKSIKSKGCTCTGFSSVAIGNLNSVSGNDSIAVGLENTCNDGQSAVFGYNNTIDNNGSSFIGGGENNSVSGSSGSSKSIVGGKNNSVTGNNGVIIGGESNEVVAMSAGVIAGRYNSADSMYGVAMGEYSLSLVDARAARGKTASGLRLKIGGGSSDTSRKDIFEVWDDGDVFINGGIYSIKDGRSLSSPVQVQVKLNSDFTCTCTFINKTVANNHNLTATCTFGSITDSGGWRTGFQLEVNGFESNKKGFDVTPTTTNGSNVSLQIIDKQISSGRYFTWNVAQISSDTEGYLKFKPFSLNFAVISVPFIVTIF